MSFLILSESLNSWGFIINPGLKVGLLSLQKGVNCADSMVNAMMMP